MWPTDAEGLIAAQRELAQREPDPWQPTISALLIGGCWVCFPRGIAGPGGAGDPVWAAAVVTRHGQVVHERVNRSTAPAPYTAGLFALRAGAVMEQVVRALPHRPDVLLLDASGRDHPRRAGLAIHLGAELDLPTVGVTHRPLLAEGDWPGQPRGDTSPLRIGDEVVAAWMRTRQGARPLVVHPGWRTDLDTALLLVERTTRSQRTPDPLRRARHVARTARAADTR